MAARPRLGQILLARGLLSEAQLETALEEQQGSGQRLGAVLLRLQLIEEETLLAVLARQLRLRVVRLAGKRVKPEMVELVPRELAEKYRCFPLFLRRDGEQQVLLLAMEDPTDLEALDVLAQRAGYPVHPVLVGRGDLQAALERHHGSPGEPGAPLDEDTDTAPAFAMPLASAAGLELAPEPAAAEGPEGAPGIAPELVLRALAQLLVEKGVLSRDEFAQRIRGLAAADEKAR